MHIVDGIRAQHHHACGLFKLFAIGGVGVEHAGDFLAAGILQYLGYPTVRAQFKIGVAHGDGNHRMQRAALGVGFAAEALAVAAVLTRAELRAVGVGVSTRGVGGGRGKRIQPHVGGGGAKHLAGQRGLDRRQRVIILTRRFKAVTARLRGALQIAGLARHRGRALKALVVRLQLGIADAPILYRHVGGNVVLAVTLLVHRAHLELGIVPAPGDAVPVHARAAHALARQEGTQPPHRQRRLLDVVADGECVHRRVLHQIMARGVTQLIADARHREIIFRLAHGPALQGQHLHPRFGEFLRQYAAAPAKTDQYHIYFFEFGCHGFLPLEFAIVRRKRHRARFA